MQSLLRLLSIPCILRWPFKREGSKLSLSRRYSIVAFRPLSEKIRHNDVACREISENPSEIFARLSDFDLKNTHKNVAAISLSICQRVNIM